MIINEEPVLVAIQQRTQMIEETLATNMKRFKGGPHSKRRHHDTRRSKRSPRETGGDGNNSFNFQSKFHNNNNSANNNQHNNSYYRNFNGPEKSGPQFQYPFNHLNVQQSFQIHQQDPFQYQHQSQQQLQQPTSPLRITPPMPSSNHPLSSFQTPNQQHQQPVPTTPSNGQPVYMYQSQVQMPLPMQYPMPIPISMPPVNYDGSPITPLQMPLHMPNMPLPVFIRLPAQPCMSPSVSSGISEDTLKSSASSASVNSLSSLSTTATTATTTSTGNPPPAAVVNFIPLLFPSHLGPMLFGTSQQIMVTPMSRSPNQFNQMVNDNGQQQQQLQRTPTAPHHHHHHHHQSSTKSI